MKRKLSLLLVLALMVSLVPMSAFAATDNSMSKVPQIKDDYKFTDKTTAPQLKIEEKSDDEFGSATTKQVFRMKLDNAEWLDDSDLTSGDFAADMANGSNALVTRLNDTTVEVTVYGDNTPENKIAYRFPMLAEAQGKGELKVTVDGRDSVISGGTYTFAVAAAGDTVATIDKVEDFTDTATIKDIQIDETKIGAIGAVTNSKVKLKLPTGFKWVGSSVNVEFTGGLTGASIDASKTVIDGRNLEFYMTTATSSTRGTIYIKGLQVTAEKDADYGDVSVSISGDDITSEDLVVAKYCDYSVSVKADGDAKEIISGRMADSYSDEEHELQTLIIEENVENAWLANRKTRVEFPSWVKVLGVEVTKDTDKVKDIQGIEGTLNAGSKVELTDKGDNYVEFTATTTGQAELYLKFFVSVEAGKSGDIIANVTGRSLDKEAEVVLGKAVAPINVKVDVKDVRTGIKGQEIGDITITEGKSEAIQGKKTLVVALDESVKWTAIPTIKVTTGNVDLDVDGAKVDKNILTIPVDSDSSKASTIVLSGIKLDLDRTVAEGDIDVKVGGSAIVENYDKDKTDDGYFSEEYAVETVGARVITPADQNTKPGEAVNFVIGQAEYKVGDVTKTADVAPYIQDGRTMLSLRYVAEAIGVKDANIIWNEQARTVTIFKGDRIAQVEIGSNKLMVNGTPIYMDTVATIKDGRTMLPVSFIAKALGLDAEWDGATQTVTIK
ncbi:copper amine oxidase N-terminal domain-containing protein [Inediibacterium massiliense]|uniref:copper amine oxidase N-terminal domain-containing protein n=1 Tax=Inediibacterium massiliense TaxID=1658111 RepID=UPI0006B51A79|nr:copper amine oxidase N-terminal domain-containing protein [Inediibacterium massiliense]